MKRLESLAEQAAWRAEVGGRSLGLVPTMGALHEGHLSLVRRSRAVDDLTLATIFVNPAQFDRGEDLEAYPRDLERDAELLGAAGCDAVFAPTPEAIYPDGFQTWVEVGPVASPLEGSARPGHFRGVATVVLKLLHLTAPRRAYFGQKDAQQLAVVRRMVRDLAVPVEIVACPTVREPDGLAMSSRNRRLSPDQRRAAAVLYRALEAAKRRWQEVELDAERLRRTMRRVLAAEPSAEVEYVSVADPETFEELDALEAGRPPLASLAVRFGDVRLIDNLPLGPAVEESADPGSEDRRPRVAQPVESASPEPAAASEIG